MNADIQKILHGTGLYLLLFALGDIFMLKGGPNIFSWILIIAGFAGAVLHFMRNWPRLGKKRPGERI